MSFAGKVWKVLVGIKDGMVLIFMLLFFIALFSILTMRPNPGQVRDGALLIQLDGYVVEERTAIDPIETLLSGEAPVSEYQARDIVRMLDAAASDDSVKAVVFDLSGLFGGGQRGALRIVVRRPRLRIGEDHAAILQRAMAEHLLVLLVVLRIDPRFAVALFGEQV